MYKRQVLQTSGGNAFIEGIEERTFPYLFAEVADEIVAKSDVVVAKNYLTESELWQLSRLVNAYLDVAESMALRKIPMTMQDWETRLNRFLAATDREVLQDAGKVTAEIARAHAESEFEKYRIVQDRLFESDFDRVVAETKRLGEGTPRKGKKS